MSDKQITEEELSKMSSEEITELQKQNCIFCKIVEKQIPAKIIHEDSDVICILDINPASEGHILVYPKKHYMILPHIPDEILSKLFSDVKLMSHTLLKSLQCSGTTIFIANGAAAGQRAPHVLIHVFPRRDNDGLVKLPKYEMSDEQILSLKRNLKPYINQMFGKSGVIEAEFVDKPKDHTRITDNNFASETKVVEHNVKENQKDNIKSKDTKSAKKESSIKDESSKKSKVDLDDIAKLFGGK